MKNIFSTVNELTSDINKEQLQHCLFQPSCPPYSDSYLWVNNRRTLSSCKLIIVFHTPLKNLTGKNHEIPALSKGSVWLQLFIPTNHIHTQVKHFLYYEVTRHLNMKKIRLQIQTSVKNIYLVQNIAFVCVILPIASFHSISMKMI